jgi:hypothetical protein
MRFAVLVSVFAIGCSGEQGDQGTVGEQGEEGAQGPQGAQGSAGPQGEKGAPGSHVEWVDGTGTPIDRFAYVSLPALPQSAVVFDANNLMWLVTINPTTFAATAGPYGSPFPSAYYTGANCTGDLVIAYMGQPRNLPFTQGDATLRLFPSTAPTSIAIQSQNFIGCTNNAANVTGYLASATVPATAPTPPTLTWSGPIEARWVE